jgi:hypothetical protein
MSALRRRSQPPTALSSQLSALSSQLSALSSQLSALSSQLSALSSQRRQNPVAYTDSPHRLWLCNVVKASPGSVRQAPCAQRCALKRAKALNRRDLAARTWPLAPSADVTTPRIGPLSAPARPKASWGARATATRHHVNPAGRKLARTPSATSHQSAPEGTWAPDHARRRWLAVCSRDDVCSGEDPPCGSPADALRLARVALDHLTAPAAAAEVEPAAVGDILSALVDLEGRLAAAQASFLRRFDAADGHDADGYGSSSAWLAAKAGLSRRDARAAVRRMREFGDRPLLRDAVAAGAGAGGISLSWAAEIARWTKRLPAELRGATDQILLDAAAAGASLEDLAAVAAAAIEQWRAQRPDTDEDFDFGDRHVQLGTTLGGAGVIRGDLTPECAAAVSAVLDALGKPQGADDGRTQGQRFHDALLEACHLLLRARMLPGRSGADTQVVVHVPLAQLRQLPGAGGLEAAWLRARLGDAPAGPGAAFLTGDDAVTAACDALTVPVVTGHADHSVIDKLIALARVTPPGAPGWNGPSAAAGEPGADDTGADDTGRQGSGTSEPRLHRGWTSRAWQAHRYAIARLAIDFVSGPDGIAAALRAGLLGPPYRTPSLPLDIGYSEAIPGHIRRAVTLRDQHCAWPGGCDRPASACDVHHVTHKADGGVTAVSNCVLLCQFHHDICVHRRGWRLTLHPDGTLEARNPDGARGHASG